MGRKCILLITLSLLLVAAGVFLFVYRGLTSESRRVLSYNDVTSLSNVSETYHSVNNWLTEEDTELTGVILNELLESQGVEEADTSVKVIALDEYFWPAVGTVLTLEDLRTPSPEGLYTILAYEMNGAVLDPEPDGTGPLRLVMPQYEEGEINKPSWVSNVRLIEVGPLEEGYEAPNALDVPVDEVWIYGDVPATYTYPLFLPIIVLIGGTVLLFIALLYAFFRGHKGSPQAAVSILIATVLISSALLVALPSTHTCRASPGTRTFSMAELKSMPAFSGHYTFLKSQPPYTYYEADYTGVPISYLLEKKMNLQAGAADVVIWARDNYSKPLSLSQVRTTYPGGLKAIIAYEKNGEALVGDEGPLRLIVPQTVPGTIEEGGEPNTPLCVRMLFSIEVRPLPAGEQAPGVGSVPEGSLAVYGAVAEPAPTPVDNGNTQPAVPDETAREEEQAVQTPQEDQAADATAEEAISGPADDETRRIWAGCAALYVYLMNPFMAVSPLVWFYYLGGSP
ncbi:MAG: molybdopterin-dependent oxidoreductase [Actinomycetota bacterium]|nr:molybdopterin-dependent oxidoreductase [Actinomycetota bacterium]